MVAAATVPAVRIAIASDHAGFVMKAMVIDHLSNAGHVIADLGTDSTEPVDYPYFCAAAARAVFSRTGQALVRRLFHLGVQRQKIGPLSEQVA